MCIYRCLSTLLFCVLASGLLFSQDSEADKLAKGLDRLSGSKYISTAFKVADLYMNEGKWDKAIDATEKAEKAARRIGNKETMAMIYQRKAEIIIQKAPAVKKYSEEAFKALQGSLKKHQGPGNGRRKYGPFIYTSFKCSR